MEGSSRPLKKSVTVVRVRACPQQLTLTLALTLALKKSVSSPASGMDRLPDRG